MSEAKTETVTFRIDAALKDEFTEIAEAEAKPVGELLRELVRQHVKHRRRVVFEAEARRQCQIINAAAQDPNSDEAQVMRELDANFDEFARELAAREEEADRKNGNSPR
ncbi:MAG TPA: ribbon-helix-helix protein, CopG family [Stellaceae bacterium]|nr:ribbon-helix-helix protein, CopG family [Stellaceae bacterium]